MKKFRDYIIENSFEDVWTAIAEIFEEPEEIKPVYEEYYKKLRELPLNPQKEEIRFVNPYGRNEYYHLGEQPLGLNGAPEYLIDKKVYLGKTDLDSQKITAILIYWASFHNFITSKEHDEDLFKYLDIISGEDVRCSLADYLYRREPIDEIIEESLERKHSRFWESTTAGFREGYLECILWVLKSAIEYNIGFMRGFADHAGREHDADRMQLCCNLIDIATRNIYLDDRGKKALRVLFKILAKDIYIAGMIS